VCKLDRLASGVDRALSFRHLFILRPDNPPGGPKTRLLVQKFLQAGGKFIIPTQEDLRTFVALQSMLKRDLVGLDTWLRERKPLFSTSLFKSADLCPPGFLQQPKSEKEKSPPSQPRTPAHDDVQRAAPARKRQLMQRSRAVAYRRFL